MNRTPAVLHLRDEQGYEWTCAECAMGAGGRMDSSRMSTYHEGICPICLRSGQMLTEVRDYGYPEFTAIFIARRRQEAQL